MKQIQHIGRDTFSWIIPLFIVALLCVLPTANADVTHERFTINDIEYLTLTEDSENRTVAVVSYSGEPTTINIPDSVIYGDNTYTVTTIWVRAFQYCTSLVSVTLPDSITTIRSFGFDHCINLSSITIPDNVTSIEDDAFEYCINLSSITIGKSLVSFGMGVFNGCSNLANIIVNTDNPSYSSEDGILFNKDKTELIQYPCGKKERNYTTPDYTTTIGRSAFGNCRNLISVTISDSVTHITRYAFSGCSNLKDVVFGKRVCSMEYSIFNGCTSLKHVYYKGCCPGGTPTLYYDTPETLTSYYNTDHEKSWAPYIQNGRWLNRKIRNIYGIEYIYNTDGTASVESIALTEDTDITIPATVEKDGVSYTVTSIPDNALDFRNIPTSITIPASVTFIGRKVFFSCENLKAIHVAPENPVYSSVDGVLFNKEQTVLIQYPSGREGEYTISSSVYYIEKSAFSGCTASISLIFSEGIEIIEPNTFYRSTGLQKIQLPPTLKVIGEDAFFGCVNLVEVNIPDSVTSIGAGAFANCKSLEEIEIPNYVEEIGDSAFYGCENLRFAYIPDSLVEVGAYMFNYCHSLESVIIGASVREIQVGAFLNCENLNTVYFLGDHPEMGYEVFLISNYFKIIRDSQNPRLLPQTNPEVYLEALRENTPVLYYLNDRLGWYSLSQEEALNVIRSCDTWSDLGTALDRCLNYTELKPNADDFDSSEGTILSYKGNSPVVVMPDRINGTTVTQIGENAFANNIGIFIIIIPGTVEVIGDKAFANCASLQTVQFRGNAPEAAENIFEGDHCVVYCENGTTGWDAVWKGVTVLSVPASSADDFTYEINDKEVTITGYTGTASHLEIPSEIEGYPVTEIKEEAFLGRFNIFTVFVPKSVTYVGFGAFANCRNLYSAEFEGETEIEDSAFYHCRNLLEITLPKGLEEVRAYTFTGCNMLQEIDLPSSLTYIGDSSFYKCASLQDIVIPQNVTEIGDSVFTYSGISNALLGSNVGTIGKLAFAGCSNLSNILFGSELETIEALAFADCTDLFDVTLPQYVFEIGDRAFSGCVNLTRITMNDGLKYIGDKVFLGCVSLPEITIPEGVISIGAEVFSECESLANIWVDEKNLVFSSLDGVLFSNDQTKLIQYPIGREDEVYFIPDGVTRIADKAFQGCTKLTDVRFPDSVSTLEHYVFQYCTNLKRACFEGNAPRFKDSMYVFEGTQVTVYCHEGTTGWNPSYYGCAGRPLFVIPYLDNRLESIGLVLRWFQTDGVVLQASENGTDDWTDITEDILLDNGYCVYRITSMEEAKSFYRLIVP